MNPFINIHTHKVAGNEHSILNLPVNGIFKDAKYFSYGIHPWDIDHANFETQFELLKKYCHEQKIIAIGEIGLDRAIKTSIKIQQDIFIKQLELAEEQQLPVIIHCVKAWSDLLMVKKNRKCSNNWIFHGFNGNSLISNQLIKSDCYLSFGGALLKNIKLQEVFQQLPLSSIFFETDDSDVKIEEIYKKAAELCDICIPELKKIIAVNFNKVFGIQCTKTG